MKTKIGIIDLNVGNIFSVIKAFKKLNVSFEVINNRKKIDECTHIVIPGVSSFKTAIENLIKLNLKEKIIENHKSGKPILGLCVGCQLLMDYSKEGGIHKGIGIIKGSVDILPKIIDNKKIKLPHVGWQSLIKKNRSENTILNNIISNEDNVYLHILINVILKKKNILATFDFYGIEEPAVIYENNSTGIQFHPELSGSVGKKILNNFISKV